MLRSFLFNVPRRWAIFVITSLLFVLSQFFRASIAVVTPQLITELSLDAKGLSLMSASFFYAFALAQIPIGMYIDHVGPRKTMTILSLVAVIGALIFAWADSLAMLILGRFLLGIGMACNLMGTFKLLTLWFGPSRFASLSGLVLSIGTAGYIVATTPLVLLVQEVGWRCAFTIFAFINLLLAIVFFLVIRDRPREISHLVILPKVSIDLRETLSNLRLLFQKKDYWIISFGTFCRYGIFAAVQTLWAGPYLMKVMGLSAFNTGNLIFFLNIGLIFGSSLSGILSDKILKTRKGIILMGIVGLSLVLFILAFMPPGTDLFVLSLLFFGIGLFASVGGVMFTHIKELMPIEMAGTAMTGTNFFGMIGAAVFIQGLGSLMQHLYPNAPFGLEAFRKAFLFCVVCLAAVSISYIFTRDTIGKFKSLSMKTNARSQPDR